MAIDTTGQAGGQSAAAAAAAQAKIPNWPWPKNFDPQQQQQLIDLSNNGQLSGIPPQIIAYMQQAESGMGYSAGGAINSAGYGGYFGLGNNKTYNAGTATTAILHGTDPLSYAAQAIIAASAFAAYMIPAGGDYIAAENIYQTGQPNSSANGAGIFESYGLSHSTSGVQDLPNNVQALGAVAGQAASSAGSSITSSADALAQGGWFGLLGWLASGQASKASDLFGALGAGIGDILGGFGIGWKGVLGILLGILFIGVGLIFLFHTQEKEAVEEVAPAAAA